MNLQTEQTEQKLRGGYYTPQPIASYLWEWLQLNKPVSILEPAAGNGALINAINGSWKMQVTATELYAEEASQITKPANNIAVNVIIDDYYNWEHLHQNIKFDAILSNPPYIRYQYLSAKQRDVQSRILQNAGLKSSKLINSWAAFVVSNIEHLKDKSRISLVIPTDILQVGYAVQIRKYLAESLSKFYVITFGDSMFPNTQQDYLLILGEKKASKETKTEFKHITAPNMTNIPNWDDVETINMPSLSAKKWTELLVNEPDRKFLHSTFNETISFTNVAKTEVGITTGNNKLFSLSKSKVDELNAQDFVLPLLGKSSSTSGLVFNKNELEDLNKSGKNNWLLTLNSDNDMNLPIKLKTYLKQAEKKHLTNGYKLSIREKWWRIPSVWVPDAFLLRRMGKMPKLILNSVHGVSTDTFHRISFHEDVNPLIIVLAFYSSITRISLELAGRTFGGGALEILPGDMQAVKLPNINYQTPLTLDDSKIQHIFSLFNHNNDSELTKYVDQLLINQYGAQFDFKRTESILNRLLTSRIG